MSLRLVFLFFYRVSFARYDAYVTSDGTNNTICSQSKPCGLFHYVIENIESGHISDDDLVIHINGSDPTINVISHNGLIYDRCIVPLTGNITFSMDPNTIHTAADWFGAGILDSCRVTDIERGLISISSSKQHQWTHVVFHHLIWDDPYPLLEAQLLYTSFHCYSCRIQNFENQYPTFQFSSEATFVNTTFYNLTGGTIIEKGWWYPPILTLKHCAMINISATFVRIEAQIRMYLH